MANVAFIGLGMMGSPMAACLIEAGHTVFVKDSNEAVQLQFLEVNSRAKAIEGSGVLEVDFIITMLPNSEIVANVCETLSDIIPESAILIDMSSSEPFRTRELSKNLEARGIAMLDAPVSGGQARAIQGSLSIMVGGSEDIYRKSLSVLEAIGKPILVGPVGAGHALKALNNYVSAAGLLAVVEALRVGEKFGLDPSVMVDVMNTSSGRNNTTETKAKQYMLSGRYNSAFSLGLMVKDLGIAVEMADTLGVCSTLAHTCRDVWKTANEKCPGADHTEMYRLI